MLDYKYLKIVRLAEDCAILAQMLGEEYKKKQELEEGATADAE